MRRQQPYLRDCDDLAFLKGQKITHVFVTISFEDKHELHIVLNSGKTLVISENEKTCGFHLHME